MITQGERKLAAIMFSDIQGYTRIMEDNERQGLSMAKRYRETLEKLAFEHGGEVVQNYGDGSLSVFGSAVNAVNCAIALQHLMMSAESIPLRIGLHLGDIVVEDDDIYGAGVNLASRIESMGVAGNILVSESICKELRNHDEITHVSLGKFDFKNVEEPIEVHAISNPGITVPRRSELSGKFREKTRIQPRLKVAGIIALIGAGLWLAYDVFMTGPLIDSLAVLPLTAQTRSEDEALLLAGVHDGLINSLGQLGEIKVISKLATLAYAGSAKSPGEIADELDVQGVITGNVHYHGDTLDINLDLVKAGRSKKSLWSRVYRSEVSDVMNLYNVVRQDLAR